MRIPKVRIREDRRQSERHLLLLELLPGVGPVELGLNKVAFDDHFGHVSLHVP